MKKFCCVSLALCLCLLLAACGGKSGKEYAYQHGNMQKFGNFMRYDDQVVFSAYTENSDVILFTYDLNTGRASTFCKDATCKHRSIHTSACVTAGAFCNLEQNKGKLYGMDLPGPILELQGDRFVPITDAPVQGFFHNGSDLYVLTQDMSLLVYEDGSKEPRMVLEEYAGAREAIFDGYLYYKSMDGVYRLKLGEENAQPQCLVPYADYITDGQYIYYCPDDTSYLYRCNMDGSGSTLLLEQAVTVNSLNFDDEFLYFSLYDPILGGDSTIDEVRRLYRFPKSAPTQVELLAELEYPVNTIFTVPEFDKLFVNTSARIPGAPWHIFLVAKDGSSVEEVQLPEL